MHYREEVNLLEEEMHRVVDFLDWHARWWRTLEALMSRGYGQAWKHSLFSNLRL
jgi:hypothetical protein